MINPRLAVLLHPELAFQARVRQAAGSAFTLRVVSSWDELKGAAHANPLTSVVVVDPYYGGKEKDGLAQELRNLLRDYPSMEVLAVVDTRLSRPRDLRALGEWGVSEIISVGEDDAASISQMLRAVHLRSLQVLVEQFVAASVTGWTHSILLAAAETAANQGRAEDLARKLHVSTRTLLRWCVQAGLPPPRHLLAWMRILIAAKLLDQPGQSLEAVADTCGYAAGSGLRRALGELLGSGVKQLRRQGAFVTASAAFRRKLLAGEPQSQS